MKKKLKTHTKTHSLILFLAIFSTFVLTKVESFAVESQTPVAQTQTQPQSPNKQPNGLQQNNTNTNQNATKVNTIPSKTKPQSRLIKFIIAMAGVLLSSLAIFGGLKLYKIFILKNNTDAVNIDYEKTLESPRDFKEAINIFLEKTDK